MERIILLEIIELYRLVPCLAQLCCVGARPHPADSGAGDQETRLVNRDRNHVALIPKRIGDLHVCRTRAQTRRQRGIDLIERRAARRDAGAFTVLLTLPSENVTVAGAVVPAPAKPSIAAGVV